MQQSEDVFGNMHREFFGARRDLAIAAAAAEMESRMDARAVELKAAGHTNFTRVKIGRNDVCPCGSGAKFKRCCIDQIG